MDVSIIGAGYVGVTTSVALAEKGHRVRLVDVQPEKLEALRRGDVPFYEPGLTSAFRAALDDGAIVIRSELRKSEPSDVVLLCVGTPARPDGGADLSQIEAAAEDAAAALWAWDRHAVVSVKSTVPPGTTRTVVLPALEGRLGDEAAACVAMTPEFLREGNALEDARAPSRIVIGTLRDEARHTLERLHDGHDCPIVTTSLDAAEMIKYASNAYLALKVTFANEMANLCEPLGLDVDEVMAGVGHDPRIGPRFLQAGCGFGGSCFPKDVSALVDVARRHGANLRLLEETLRLNDEQPLHVRDLLELAVGDVDGKRIALLGLAFKPDTSDVRETRALPIYRALREAGADVVCHDPEAGPAFRELVGHDVALADDALDALDGADACVIQTAWSAYRELDPDDVARRMRRPVVVDARRALDAEAMGRAGIDYVALGNGLTLRRYHESRHSRSGTGIQVPARH